MRDLEILHSRRLLLKDFEEIEGRDFLKNKNFDYFLSNESFDDFLRASFEDENSYLRSIVKFGEAKSLGLIVADVSKSGRGAEIKLIISDAFKNRGYGTESLNLVSHYLFTGIGVEKIRLKVQLSNAPMIEVAKKANYQEISKNKDFIYYELSNVLYMLYYSLEA